MRICPATIEKLIELSIPELQSRIDEMEEMLNDEDYSFSSHEAGRLVRLYEAKHFKQSNEPYALESEVQKLQKILDKLDGGRAKKLMSETTLRPEPLRVLAAYRHSCTRYDYEVRGENADRRMLQRRYQNDCLKMFFDLEELRPVIIKALENSLPIDSCWRRYVEKFPEDFSMQLIQPKRVKRRGEGTIQPIIPYLHRLTAIAEKCGVTSYCKDEAKDFLRDCNESSKAINQPRGYYYPDLKAVEKQWTLFNPDEHGDPFGITDFWQRGNDAKFTGR